jgi:TetR/AcrR family acrAB operon transcriptional repressor
MRRTQKDTEITHQAILDAALKVFSRQGYAATRLEDIAKEAGVTRGAVYHHFDGKTELYEALTTERFEAAMQGVNQIMTQGGSPRELIRSLMIHSLELLEDDGLYRTVQELVLFKTSFSPELEKVITAKINNTNNLVNYLRKIVTQGIQANEFRSDLDPQSAAVAIVGLVNGVTMLWLMSPQSFSLKKKAATIADSFLLGLVGS